MAVDLEQYRASAGEQARTTSLLSLLPRDRRTVLDVGARDGYFSRLMADAGHEVTALDLERPSWSIPGVRPIAGDACALDFPNNSFDVFFCAEVLEHIPASRGRRPNSYESRAMNS
jgi:2-polyprenyl-3-methyl-5-hydroxy-6-metoxy-1,4-benzoquinol methylase